MSWFVKFERRFHNFGIPGLIRLVAILQALVFLLGMMKPDFMQVLALDVPKIMEGQIWRVLTFALIPTTTHVIWIIFVVMLLFLIGDGLEAEWGSFRVTLYYFGTMALLCVAAWHDRFGLLQLMTAQLLYQSIFLGFAITFPTYPLNICGILPVQARWLGWLDLGYMGYLFYTAPPLRLGIALSLVPFLLIAIPVWVRHSRHRIRVGMRRAEYVAASLPEGDHFHKCSVCGRTDVSHPELEFRVLEDDTERCTEHLS